MNRNIQFIEKSVDCDNLNYKYQYDYDYATVDQERELYEWCLENFGELGWIIGWSGVLLLNEEDAMAFKLRWM